MNKRNVLVRESYIFHKIETDLYIETAVTYIHNIIYTQAPC